MVIKYDAMEESPCQKKRATLAERLIPALKERNRGIQLFQSHVIQVW